VCEVDISHTPPLSKWAHAAATIDCHDWICFAEVRRTEAGFVVARKEDPYATGPRPLAHGIVVPEADRAHARRLAAMARGAGIRPGVEPGDGRRA
jgi:hypothetical protein